VGAGRPVEVAIVGGGCASIAAAFELTRPEHRGRYRVTLYQQGWRLGGKGASGRGPAGRIEEHGLHVWMGFYENAFRLLRECYTELGRDPARCPLADWSDAFQPDPITGVLEPAATGHDRQWLAYFPPGGGTPGDPSRRPKRASVTEYLVRSAQLLGALLQSAPGAGREGERPAADGAVLLLEQVRRWLRWGQLATLAGTLEGVRLLESALAVAPGLPPQLLRELVERVGAAAHAQLESLVTADSGLRRLWDIAELVLAILRGSVRFGLVLDPRGFDAIADYDWRDWLRLNGASQRALDSPFLHSLYDLAFAYEDGDRTRPRAAASEALRCAVLAFLGYRGSFFWKMRAGMGDVVFAPFYEVLKRRGVRFRFFHRLENVHVAEEPDGSRYVETLDFDVQARTAKGGEYSPLIDVRGIPSWPSEPDWMQLEDGERQRAEAWDFESFWDRRRLDHATLRVREDFDFVVLGIGLGAIPFVCREILARDERWCAMVSHVGTAATQAFQLWLHEPIESLGWTGPPINVTGFDARFETWADMRQLLPTEGWAVEPAAIAYFCSSLPTPRTTIDREDATYPAKERERVRASAIQFLDEEIGRLWPGAVRDGRFRWELLVDPATPHASGPRAANESLFDTQVWTANVNPSDRYTLSLPGSSRYRISPLDRSWDNLTIAGDWTSCGLNVGCVEAAVMSGRLAAHAIAGTPALEEIAGYDHP